MQPDMTTQTTVSMTIEMNNSIDLGLMFDNRAIQPFENSITSVNMCDNKNKRHLEQDEEQFYATLKKSKYSNKSMNNSTDFATNTSTGNAIITKTTNPLLMSMQYEKAGPFQGKTIATASVGILNNNFINGNGPSPQEGETVQPISSINRTTHIRDEMEIDEYSYYVDRNAYGYRDH